MSDGWEGLWDSIVKFVVEFYMFLVYVWRDNRMLGEEFLVIVYGFYYRIVENF